MKDSNKIKEKDSKGDVKIIFIVGAIFLVAFGLIVYGIVKLTNQYFSLKEQLSEKKVVESAQTTTPDNGKKITVESDNIKVEDIKKQTEEAISDNKAKKYAVEEKKPEAKPDTKVEPKIVQNTTPPEEKKNDIKTEQKNESKTEPKAESKIEQTKTKQEKEKIVLNADKSTIKKEPADNRSSKKVEEKKLQQAKKEESINSSKQSIKPKQETGHKESKAKPKEPSAIVDQTSKSGNGNYSLQLMAFKDEEHTKKEAEKLKSKLKDVYIVKADLGEKGVWYRIRYGKNLTKEEALKLKEKLQKEYNINAILARN